MLDSIRSSRVPSKMHPQIAKTVNPSCFPMKYRGFPAPGLNRALFVRSRPYLILVNLILFSVFATNCRMIENTETPTPATQPNTRNDATELHRRAIAIDMHADTPQRLLDERVDLAQRLPDGHFDSVRAREGGLDAQFFSIWVEPQLFGGGGPTAMKRADDQIAAVRALAERHPETWQFATTAADIRRIASAGKLAALTGLEGGHAMVREMNRLGMMVDVAHVSDKTFWDIVNTSTKPVIATHSGCRAVANVPRNLTDEMIQAIAKTGGVVNVIFYPAHLEPGLSEKKKQV